MSAVTDLQAALFGNPPSANFLPSREGVLAAFQELYDQITALTIGISQYDTVAHLPATPPAGTQARVYADGTSTNNTYWIYKSGAWAIDTDFITSIASLIAGLSSTYVTAAAASATAAAASATGASGSATAAAASAAGAAAAVLGSAVTYGLNPPVSGGSTANGGFSLISKTASGKTGKLSQVQVWSTALFVVPALLFVASVSGSTGTLINSTFPVMLQPGLNTFNNWNAPITSTQYVGIESAIACISQNTGGSVGYWFCAGVVSGGGSALTSVAGTTLEIGFTVSDLLTGETARASGDTINLTSALALVTGAGATVEGVVTPAAQTASTGGYTRFGQGSIQENGTLASISFYPSASGTVTPVVASFSGGVMTLQAIGAPVAVTSGAEVVISNPVGGTWLQAGWNVGLYSLQAIPDYQSSIGGAVLNACTGLPGGGVIGGTSTISTFANLVAQIGWSMNSGVVAEAIRATAKEAALLAQINANIGAGISASPIALASGDYAAVTDWTVVITVGESLGSGHNSTPVLSVTSPWHKTFGGGTRSSKVSSVGSNSSPGVTTVVSLFPNTLAADGDTLAGETGEQGFANGFTLIAARESGVVPGTQIFFMGNACHLSYTMENISPGDPSNWYQLVPDQLNAIKTLATAAGKSVSLFAIKFMQGATDLTNSISTNMTLMQALRSAIEASAQSIFGQTSHVPMLVSQMSSHILTYSGSVQQATFNLCMTDPYFDFVGPTHQYPYASDNIHLANIGQMIEGNVSARNGKRRLIDKVKPPWLHPIGAPYCLDQTVYLKYSVPVLPMQFIGNTLQRGFNVTDGSGNNPISSVSIVGDTIVMPLSRALASAPVLNYGMNYLDAQYSIVNGASGDVCDSTPDFFTHSSTKYPMLQRSPHFSLNIQNFADQ